MLIVEMIDVFDEFVCEGKVCYYGYLNFMGW